MFTYIRLVKFNVQILNGSKSPAKGFGIIMVKTPKTSIIKPLCPLYYMPQNPQNTIIQTVPKNHNQFRSVKTEDLRWFNSPQTQERNSKLKQQSKEDTNKY